MDTSDKILSCNRRALMQQGMMGIAGAAFSTLLARDSDGREHASEQALQRPDHAPRVRNVIFLHMVGGPSQLDLLSFKPELQRRDGQKMPDALWENLRLAFVRKQPNLFGSPFKFERHGQSGIELSELLPYLGKVADELTVVHSLHTEQFNHAPAQLMFQTGFGQFGRPSLGSWVSYGLGSENENLPNFVVMNTGQIAGAGNSMWGSGFLLTGGSGALSVKSPGH